MSERPFHADPARPSAHSTCWRVNPEAELHWRHWDENWVVFNAASGQTHFINAYAATLLRELQAEGRGPSLDQVTLIRHSAATLDLEPDGELTDYLNGLLGSLDELGLVVSSPCP